MFEKRNLEIFFSLILWNSFWENLFAGLCWNSADSICNSASVAWQIKCSVGTRQPISNI